MSTKEVKVMVGIPALGEIKVETTMSLISYYRNCINPTMIAFSRNTYTHTARNRLVWDAVDRGATHLMFVDDDMEFPHEAIDHLISHDKDIVGGLYFKRVSPTTPVIKYRDKDVLRDFEKIPSTDKLFEVDAIGTGFLLIKMDVFKKIDPPYFYFADPEDYKLKRLPFPEDSLGEDISFCMRAKEAGFKIWCDPTVKINHIGVKKYNYDDFA